MKKIISFLFVALFVVACSSKTEYSFKGNEYRLLNAPNDATVTLSFDATENRFFGRVVNGFFGSYETDGNKITFGPAASTMMMGPEELMEAEFLVIRSFPNVRTFSVSENGLILNLEDGTSLEFEKVGPAPTN